MAPWLPLSSLPELWSLCHTSNRKLAFKGMFTWKWNCSEISPYVGSVSLQAANGKYIRGFFHIGDNNACML